MRFILSILSLFILNATSAQTSVKDTTRPATAGVIVHKDPRLDVLVRKQSEINTATRKATARTMKGYRLLVVNTNKRDEALSAKTKIYTYFPELKAYLSYRSPYFKLKAGNFKTREEAEKYQREMTRMFPKGVFVVNDIIEVKPERED
jgi:hypothetical protein